LRETVFAEQLKNYFQQIALPDNWIKQMLRQAEIWKNEKENSTIKIVENNLISEEFSAQNSESNIWLGT